MNKDNVLDIINAIKVVQESLKPIARMTEEFWFAGVQLEMAIRLMRDGLIAIDNIDGPSDSAGKPIPITK